MKTIGLIGGMSWESSVVYYQLINRKARQMLGGVHSARTLMYSVDFGEVAELQHEGKWIELGWLMGDAARRLEAGGADLVVLCTNTMHKVAAAVETAVDIPFLHIGDAVGENILATASKVVGLLGTKFTMEQDFLKGRLLDSYGIKTLIPDDPDREMVHSVIYDELVKGVIKDRSRQAFLTIIDSLTAAGAQGIVLGCTEIPLLVAAADTDAVLFDTTKIHAERAFDLAMELNGKS